MHFAWYKEPFALYKISRWNVTDKLYPINFCLDNNGICANSVFMPVIHYVDTGTRSDFNNYNYCPLYEIFSYISF